MRGGKNFTHINTWEKKCWETSKVSTDGCLNESSCMWCRLTSVFLLHAELSLQGLSELPLSDKLHLQLRSLQLVLLLLRPGILYGNPQQTLLGDTQSHINRLHTEQKPGDNLVFLKTLMFELIHERQLKSISGPASDLSRIPKNSRLWKIKINTGSLKASTSGSDEVCPPSMKSQL